MNLPLKRWKSCVCQWNLRPSDDFIAREWRSPGKYLSTSSNACEFFSFSNCLQLTFQVMRCLRFWFVRCEHVRSSFWERESDIASKMLYGTPERDDRHSTAHSHETPMIYWDCHCTYYCWISLRMRWAWRVELSRVERVVFQIFDCSHFDQLSGNFCVIP